MKRNPNYILEDSDRNEMIFNCLVRNKKPSPWELELTAKAKAYSNEYNSRKMDKLIVDMWLLNLRSGLYLQERTQLKGTGNYYSAMGVLLEITKSITGGDWNGTWFKPKNAEFTKRHNQSCYDAPYFVKKKLGIKDLDIKYSFGGYQTGCIAQLNEIYTFDELANIIENEYCG